MSTSVPRYDYSNPLHDWDIPKQDHLLTQLIQTPAFQRLKDVRFLGGIDYVLVPTPNGSASNTRYNRFQHSIGVARLALKYAELRELNEQQRKLAYTAALLHDIGHAPLSHSLEPLFEDAFGINHHHATADLIKGKFDLGAEIHGLLKKHNVDPDQVIEVIDGRHDPFEGFFSGPINFDTIEGILRSRQYINPHFNFLTPDVVVHAAINRSSDLDAKIVDSFWSCKDDVYRLLIRSGRGVFADYICQYLAKKALSRLSRMDYFSSEKNLFKKIPEIRKFLRSRLARQSDALPKEASISYKVRSFHVIPDVSFFSREDCRRYRQSKTDGILNVPNLDARTLEVIDAERPGGRDLREREELF